MTYSINNVKFQSREKHLQKIIKEDKRFLEFLKDKDVKRKTLVDEKGRKMDIKGSIDLKKKYGLTNKDLKGDNDKKSKKAKKVKKENKDCDHEDSEDDCMATTVDESVLVENEEEEMECEDIDLETVLKVDDDKISAAVLPKPDVIPVTSNIVTSKTNHFEQKKVEEVNKKSHHSEQIKKVQPEKKVEQKKSKEMKMSKGALDKFKMMMMKNLEKDEEEVEDVVEDKIHKEFTFTVSGQDAPDGEYSDDEMDQQMNEKNKKKERPWKEDKKLSEAEKMDLLLLTLDTNSIKKSADSILNMDELSKNKRRKLVREEVEKEVALEDYQEILTGSRFKNLRENATFSIDEIKSNAIKKRLLMKGK